MSDPNPLAPSTPLPLAPAADPLAFPGDAPALQSPIVLLEQHPGSFDGSMPSHEHTSIDMDLPSGVGVGIDPESGEPMLLIEDEEALAELYALAGGSEEEAERAAEHVPEPLLAATEGRGDLVYKINKVTKFLWRVGFASAYVPYTRKFHDTYLYYHLGNPQQDFFRESPRASRMYDRKTRLGRATQRVMLPREYRKLSLAELRARREELRETGSQHQKFAGRLMIGSNYVRIAGNAVALGACALGDGECSGRNIALTSSDIATSGAFVGVQRYHVAGGGFVASARRLREAGDLVRYNANQQSAYRAFKIGKSLSMLAYTVQMVNGAIRLHIEIDKWQSGDPTASVAQIVDAGADIGEGGARTIYSGWLVQQGLSTMQRTRDVKLATDVMSVSARVMPPALIWTMRGFGVVGGAISLGRSGVSIAEGVAGREILYDWNQGVHYGDALSDHDATHMIVGGSLGAVSALGFIGASWFIPAAALTLGTACALVGMAFLIAFLIYNFADPLDRDMLPQQAMAGNDPWGPRLGDGLDPIVLGRGPLPGEEAMLLEPGAIVPLSAQAFVGEPTMPTIVIVDAGGEPLPTFETTTPARAEQRGEGREYE